MLSKKSTKDFVKQIADKYGLPKKVVHKLLLYGAKNMCEIIESGEDLRFPGFEIKVNKEAYAKYLQKVRENAEKRLNNQSPGDDLG